MFPDANLVKVDLLVLQSFLEAQEDAYWALDSSDPSFSRDDDTAEELIDFLRFFVTEHVYIYGIWELDPYGIACSVSWDNVPEIKTPDELYPYTIRGDGSDFLYFADCKEMASNGEYITLMLVDGADYRSKQEFWNRSI